ncbi:YceI family protein [uncultured Litoreibacter sp.]|uniref:YceI family protein n=1 Tax=uncultured Litoreibacter sp. TaxID=1392394 RepID=UPI002617A17D|nr:YceI family protein [uncultured Litoreibacter sp.]
MTHFTRRALITSLAALPFAGGAFSAPSAYALQPRKSNVGFSYQLAGKPSKGNMPVKRASVMIDVQALEKSSIDVEVDVKRAKTGFIFATEALKAASVLDAKNFPTIRFRSTTIRLNGNGRLSDGAEIDGRMTIKGITRPVTLQAALFRQAGTQANDLSQLSFRVNGRISRAAFGATGYADLVDDAIELDITARVKRN